METSVKNYLKYFVKFTSWDNMILKAKFFNFKIIRTSNRMISSAINDKFDKW